MKQRPTQHSHPRNELLEAAKAATEKEKRPRRESKTKTVSLFDIPAIAKACMNTMRARGIGLVQVKSIIAIPGAPAQVNIRYFTALDRIGDAERVGAGMSTLGRYADYAVAVGDMAIIRWRKPEVN